MADKLIKILIKMGMPYWTDYRIVWNMTEIDRKKIKIVKLKLVRQLSQINFFITWQIWQIIKLIYPLQDRLTRTNYMMVDDNTSINTGKNGI